jgi:hypothetical protein
MKITKTQLRRIIAEELDNIQETQAPALGATSLARGTGMAGVKSKLGRGAVQDALQALKSALENQPQIKKAQILGGLMAELGVTEEDLTTMRSQLGQAVKKAASAGDPSGKEAWPDAEA